jgi:flagellar hook-associated protein 1 FlgK
MDGKVQKLAYEATGAAGDAATSKSLFNQALNVRSQTSGVSLEQEAVELLQIQHTFQAVSRLIATLNDMFDSVLAMKR